MVKEAMMRQVSTLFSKISNGGLVQKLTRLSCSTSSQNEVLVQYPSDHAPIPQSIEDAALQHTDYFEVGDLFTVEDLFKARVHLGHKQGLRNEFMTPYIYGNRMEMDIIDLDQTAYHLRLALNVTAHLAYRQGILLFINRSRQHALLVESTARECGEYAHCRYWSGGLFTNSSVQYKSVTRLPDACLFVGSLSNVLGTHKAVHEAAKMQILTIGIVDTNSDPRLITYPVPGNDDSPSAVQLYCDLFKKAVLIGKERRKKDLA